MNIIERKKALEDVKGEFLSMKTLIGYTNNVIESTISEGKKLGVDIEFPTLSGNKETFLELAELVREAGYTDVHLKVDDEKKNFVLSFVIF